VCTRNTVRVMGASVNGRLSVMFLFFEAEGGIRSWGAFRGLGNVYKGQVLYIIGILGTIFSKYSRNEVCFWWKGQWD
uniref:hypothetical protein n=1 Tax=Escherichia coli TaxID=562 RepID=UPI00197A7DBE